MLLYRCVWTAPSSNIRDVAMGYPLDVLYSSTLPNEVRSTLLGRTIYSNICQGLVAAVSSSPAVDCALLGASSFDDPLVFDTGATSHMTAKFKDFADFISVLFRRWNNGLGAYDAGEGHVHLLLQDNTCSPFAPNWITTSTFLISSTKPMVIYAAYSAAAKHGMSTLPCTSHSQPMPP
jgi:hypothetical protein